MVAERCPQTEEKWQFLIIFGRFNPFPEFFGEMKALLKLRFANIVEFVTVSDPIAISLSVILGSKQDCCSLVKWSCLRFLVHFEPFQIYCAV